ncbi:DeoR/GlpR family DNA-binding transcription regulator [Sinomonas sp. ASV322]|uniref:DeoR/GlpR family DNA-binding transcription regulator n=1 Tax=Sinomonas sp. ASV322 TaxID=3041920 RepID=UPI0027DC428A|nr:DeoR/GlpR family DNA-binding transcription regulator [Sinomonas sp. ASV322]MDQ4501327.1 DeoR/GlpR family DNA-binding transcription regulator [Sinomonas sp. ASV322]
MFAEERQRLVAARVAEAGRVSVTELAERFAVTTETVRRDLAALEQAGVLRRVHGGAVPADDVSTTETTLSERLVQHLPQKLLIAEAAAQLIATSRPGSVLLDAGSSTEALVDVLLRMRPSRSNGAEQHIITNALPIADKLAASPAHAVHLLGGRIRGLTKAAVGPETIDAVERLRPDLAVIGTNGVDAAFGLSTPDTDEAAVKAAFVRAARRVVVLADGSKLGVETLVQFARLDQLDSLVTDADPEPDLAAALDKAGVEVVKAVNP